MNRFLLFVVAVSIGSMILTGCNAPHVSAGSASTSQPAAGPRADSDEAVTSTSSDVKRHAVSGSNVDRERAAVAPDHDAQPSDSDQNVNNHQQNATANAVPVATTIVRFAAVPITVVATGSVTGGANSQAALAFPEFGRIAHVDVAVGQRVAAGQTIAQLDERPFTIEAAQMRAALLAAQANYARIASGARPQFVAQTNAQIENARLQFIAAKRNLARQDQLFRLGIAAQVDVETARTAVASAQSQLQVYEQQQSAQVQPFGPDVSAAHAGIAQAEAGLAAAQQKVGYATLTAPFAGIVIARLHNDGESVDPTMPVLQIATDTAAIFTADFAPEDAQHIHRGDKATIKTQGTNATAMGTVIALNPQQANAARTVPVLIQLTEGGLVFGPGAYGTASITIGSQRGLVVPSSAIVSDPTTGTLQVFRKSGDRYVPVSVDVKQESGSLTAIGKTPELRAGDVIVARGAYELTAPVQNTPKDPDMK